MKRKMLICADVYPDFSGIARYSKGMSDKLSDTHDITIACKRREGESEKETIDGVKVVRLKVSDMTEFMKNSRGKFDRVLVRYYPFLPGAVENFEDFIYVIPSVRTVSLKYKVKKSSTMDKDAAIKSERDGVKACKNLVFPSDYIRRQVLEDYGVDNGIVIPHAIDSGKFESGEEKDFECIVVANFNDLRKGIDRLIPLMKEVNGKLVILGEGRLREEYQRLIDENNLKDKVELVGKQESSNFMKRSKILISPSKCEAFGFVLLEGMASELPILAYRPDGKTILTASDEIITDGETGFLVDDDAEMIEKINLLISNEKLRKEMGNKALKYARENNWDNYIKKLENYLGEKL
jgi:glycosyltransferase involved in cell wall biosynthesis